MNVKDSPLYKSLCKSVRKQDHAELLRMLEMVPETAYAWQGWRGFRARELRTAFNWGATPQGRSYWDEASNRILAAGFDNY